MIRRCLPLVLALSLVAPALAAPEGQQTLYSFVKPTDVVKVESRAASFPELTAEPTAEGEVLRRFTFTAAPSPSLRLSPAKGDWDWAQAGAISLRVQNAMDWAITLNVRIESRDGQALVSRIDLPAGPAQTLLVPLAATSPRALGMRAGAPMPIGLNGQRLLLAETVEGALDPTRVSAVTLSMDSPDVPQSVLLGRFGVQAGDAARQAAYGGIIDAYGQYSRGQWPEKVHTDQQLREGAAREREQLKAWLAERPRQDSFGGWLGGPSFEAKGFFRTEKRDGRWYLVTPEGNPFFSLGVNAVSPYQGRTYVEGRETMFAALPAEGERLAAYYGQADSRGDSGATRGRAFAQGRWFDFYQANLQRSYAEPCVPAPTPLAATPAPAEGGVDGCARVGLDAVRWVGHSLDRLQAWGFNSLGNWSDDRLAQAKRMPYSIPLSISGDYATISTGHDWWGGMPDPFDPRFAMAAERAIAIATRDRRDDPWLLGYFADNELAWAAPGAAPKARYALAYGTLRLSTDVPAKRAFLKQLRDKYRNHAGLSKAWGIELKAWELIEDPGFEAPLPRAEFPQIERDLQAFQRLFAETYFKTIADSLEWHAPNQLLLGGRFAVVTPEAIEACARYCDVLSFNFYTREPQQGYDFAALRALDKPLLVSEFHFGSRDRGPFWGGLSEVPTEERRGPAYAHFLARALEEPGIVGVHWFQYLDQPVSGRLLDGENGHFGLVGITDRPWQGFVEQVRAANLKVPAALLAKPAAKP
ncbi:beta-agarase [Pseudomonas sp. CAU 1711]|uniref:beta-agarase n=1 Tax=Pseudomonas sp. CAU 1711 TaxID=3140356 RepID=UPI003261ACD3